MPDDRKSLGAEGERAAESFLRRQRYTILERNYRCRAGEVDLIALDGRVLVFIEVKTRRYRGTGSPLEAVGHHKQRQIARVAQHYVSTHRLEGRNARFDVVGIWWENGEAHCELVRNAFELE